MRFGPPTVGPSPPPDDAFLPAVTDAVRQASRLAELASRAAPGEELGAAAVEASERADRALRALEDALRASPASAPYLEMLEALGSAESALAAARAALEAAATRRLAPAGPGAPSHAFPENVREDFPPLRASASARDRE